MNSCELTTFITALANAISCTLSIDEISLLSSLSVQLGDTLATIAAQRAFCEKSKGKSEFW